MPVPVPIPMGRSDHVLRPASYVLLRPASYVVQDMGFQMDRRELKDEIASLSADRERLEETVLTTVSKLRGAKKEVAHTCICMHASTRTRAWRLPCGRSSYPELYPTRQRERKPLTPAPHHITS